MKQLKLLYFQVRSFWPATLTLCTPPTTISRLLVTSCPTSTPYAVFPFTSRYFDQPQPALHNSADATSRVLAMDEINRLALEYFVNQPVNNSLIAYLANAARSVVSCDPSFYSGAELSLSPPKTPKPDHQAFTSLPTVEQFIRHLAVSSNAPVYALMASLVYLKRIRARLQLPARGIRCTSHRIFLGSLILASKYLNDAPPINKNWAKYTTITTNYYQFSFSCTEVNLMEKELLALLEWDLHIHENDLYQEFSSFLEPLHQYVLDVQARKSQRRDEKQPQKDTRGLASQYSQTSLRRHFRFRTLLKQSCHRAASISELPALFPRTHTTLISSSRQQSTTMTPVENWNVHTSTAAHSWL